MRGAGVPLADWGRRAAWLRREDWARPVALPTPAVAAAVVAASCPTYVLAWLHVMPPREARLPVVPRQEEPLREEPLREELPQVVPRPAEPPRVAQSPHLRAAAAAVACSNASLLACTHGALRLRVEAAGAVAVVTPAAARHRAVAAVDTTPPPQPRWLHREAAAVRHRAVAAVDITPPPQPRWLHREAAAVRLPAAMLLRSPIKPRCPRPRTRRHLRYTTPRPR